MMCQNADECRVWAKQSADQTAQLTEALGIETTWRESQGRTGNANA
jgi:hypothetical protein